MQSTVATLLLVTTAVVLVCVVVNYSVTVMEQSLNSQDIPQLGSVRNLENNLLNQTSQLLNETQPQIPDPSSP
ncbi:MAG TPA: hypothetical protein VMD05_09860 [Candidatus Nanoarchaeia archaeon]|nr:hypothetical protein [Candidatus Nanoarchaeia archaeon]